MDSYWLASAFWYCSLVLSILAILTSAQQIGVLDLLDSRQTDRKPASARLRVRRYLPLMLTEVPPRNNGAGYDENDIGEWRPRWKMVFTWQCSIMFLAYSVTFYLVGLTIFICTPLIRRDTWSTGSNVSTSRPRQVSLEELTNIKVAVIFLVMSAVAGAIFIFCSFWIYHYIDLEDDLEESTEREHQGILGSNIGPYGMAQTSSSTRYS